MATGYQDTGRLNDTVRQYEPIVKDGKYTWRQNIRYNDHLEKSVILFNVAGESGRRMEAIREFEALRAWDGPTAAIGQAAGQFTDSEALRLDRMVISSAAGAR